ncbi:hypothetical protein TH30_19480 [Thalassospira profundimaris]|uniref:Uncharacterized protein n=2 Tax=Thalassospira profundimaris TaxID=502049 RepID=A0A367WRY2_9PROT|nr:hypothetical protein TH30_19480 [Thalassospira profundimaris]
MSDMNILDAQQLAGDLIYRYLSVQYHCRDSRDLVRTGRFDDTPVDVEALNHDLTTMMSAFGMYMRDLGMLANGRSHIHPERSDATQLNNELYDTARRVHHTIKHLYCPPLFHKSSAWQDFCQLVAQIAGEEPVFGRTRDYKLSRQDQIEELLTLARYTGYKVCSSSWLNRMLGRPKLTSWGWFIRGLVGGLCAGVVFVLITSSLKTHSIIEASYQIIELFWMCVPLSMVGGGLAVSIYWVLHALGKPDLSIRDHPPTGRVNQESGAKPTADYDSQISAADASVKRVYTGTPDQFSTIGMDTELNRTAPPKNGGSS